MNDFKNWLDTTETAISVWPDELVTAALKENKTYASAKRWLEKQKPSFDGNFTASPSEAFRQNVVKAMFEQAIKSITQLAMGQEVPDNAGD